MDQLLIGELNSARILSIVALSGSLAVQCAEKGEEKKVDLIRDWTALFAEVKLAPWIEANHGMEGLREYLHPRNHMTVTGKGTNFLLRGLVLRLASSL